MRGLGRVLMVAAGLVFVALLATPALAASPHASGVEGSSCVTCHSPHRAVGALLLKIPESDAGLSGVCLSCHAGGDSSTSNVVTGTVDSFRMPSGHSLETETAGSAQISGCETCHYTHGSSTDSRRIPARVINGVEVSSAGKDLCLACHDSADSWYGPGYPSTAQPTRDAAGYPVLGTWPGPGTYASSSNAHRLIPESTRTVGVSEPILRAAGDCLYCHGAHGGANDYDGLVSTYTVPTVETLASDKTNGSYAALCFDCHGGQRPEGFESTPVDVKQFATASGGSGGHSIVSSDAALPAGSPLPCFECHNAHGSARGNLSQISDERGGSLGTTNSAGVRAFCFTCHATSDTAAGWDSDTGTYQQVSSADEIVGVPRDGGVLILPVGDGHAEGDPASCYDCHGNDYSSGGTNVHNPGDGTASLLASFTSGMLSLAASDTVAATATVDSSATALVATQTAESTETALVVAQTAEVAGAPTALESWASTDLVAPLSVSDAQAAYVASATITLSAVDNTGGVGIAETYYVLDGGEIATGTVVNTSVEGDHTLTFWSVDFAGNAETPTSVAFTISSEQALAPTRQVRVTAARLGRWIELRRS